MLQYSHIDIMVAGRENEKFGSEANLLSDGGCGCN